MRFSILAKETIDISRARRLALACSGLLPTAWGGFPNLIADHSPERARQAAMEVIERFGYLQLDTVSIAGARSHAIVLLSRLEGFPARLGEELLQPGRPLFEYWGHEASWIPMKLYPLFEFRRQAYAHHPWWGDLIGQYPQTADELRKRICTEGPLRSADLEGRGGRGWWDLKIAKRVASALWSSGEWAIRERCRFQRIFDLSERVIDPNYLRQKVGEVEALERLLLLALRGHGWATTSTLSQTWRLRNAQKTVGAALRRLEEKKQIVSCALREDARRRTEGWIQPSRLESAERLQRIRPAAERGVLLSPFDPLLWDRARTAKLFDFDQVLEIYKPAARRRYGYYCLPVLAGDRLIARVDLKAQRSTKTLKVLSLRHEELSGRRSAVRTEHAVAVALGRYAGALELKLEK